MIKLSINRLPRDNFEVFRASLVAAVYTIDLSL